MVKSAAFFTLAAATMAASAHADSFHWDKACGTQNDRLVTDTLKMTTPSGHWKAGQKAHITASGTTMLHAPLQSGAWNVRVYEDGMPKYVSENFGDLMAALKFDDAKNTTFTINVDFDMPKAQKTGEFTANFYGTDDQKAQYYCIDVKYTCELLSFRGVC